jgi:hypothetical protein
MTQLNLEYYQNLTKQVNNVGSCARLQELSTEAMGSLNAQIAGLNEQIAALQPLLALLQPPSANLGQVISWITNFINTYLAPTIKPYTVELTQLTLITAQIAELQQAISSASVKFPNCHITP